MAVWHISPRQPSTRLTTNEPGARRSSLPEPGANCSSFPEPGANCCSFSDPGCPAEAEEEATAEDAESGRESDTMQSEDVFEEFEEVEEATEGIGGQLIEFAKREFGCDYLWALEKNTRAIAFYQAHGFVFSGERKLEEGTPEFLVRLKRGQ